MEPVYEEYEENLKREHRFAWIPKYETEFGTNLTAKEFIAIAQKAIEDLGWDIVFKDNKTIEAKRKDEENEKWTEVITTTIADGKIKTTSVSLENEIWDFGRNSKRVNVFIYAFQEVEKTFNKEELKQLVNENEAKDNWDDYLIPETLPLPKVSKPKIYLAVTGALILSILLALTLAEISIQGTYVIGVFEVLIGLAIGFTFKYLIKLSNFTNFDKLHYLFIIVIALTYILNQYLQYEIVLFQNNFDRISFFEFMKIRLEQGLMIKGLNTGWIGFIVCWLLQLVITYYVAIGAIIRHLIEFQLERVSPEVVEFAVYHFVKNKTEDQVRKELAQKGWTEIQNQDEVIEAVGALQTTNEMVRMK